MTALPFTNPCFPTVLVPVRVGAECASDVSKWSVSHFQGQHSYLVRQGRIAEAQALAAAHVGEGNIDAESYAATLCAEFDASRPFATIEGPVGASINPHITMITAGPVSHLSLVDAQNLILHLTQAVAAARPDECVTMTIEEFLQREA
ncbi:hypothetical protein EHF33_20515 (plasmid) [Deinococcus psychrotolerans]|uniref:Uncharacterized protein n=1 Tax=Deinococcus psychrotolerans TaxID=2489213 RepID=A0A3G8YK71_9DEIO|nr:hypothetical protein [Deinococcus psychrotolerans]AZI45295.1 hypothetical protein EHF33_20515 [Deinococcus psychrotolerans]